MADDLVTLSSKRVTGYQCCGGDHVLSCNLANVQLENLGTEKVNLSGNLTLDFLNNVNGNLNTYHYGSNDGEAVVTYNPKNNELHGYAFSTDGKSYVLDFCGSSGYVWKLLDTDNMPDDLGLNLPTNRLALELPSLQLSLSEPEPEEVFAELEAEMSSVAPPVPPPTTAPVICELGWAASSIKTLKKIRFRKNISKPRIKCLRKCQDKTKEGCIAYNFSMKKRLCTLKKLRFKKMNKVCTGVPELEEQRSPMTTFLGKYANSLKTYSKTQVNYNIPLCQWICQMANPTLWQGCVAFNVRFKNGTQEGICELMMIGYGKKKGMTAGINRKPKQIQ